MKLRRPALAAATLALGCALAGCITSHRPEIAFGPEPPLLDAPGPVYPPPPKPGMETEEPPPPPVLTTAPSIDTAIASSISEIIHGPIDIPETANQVQAIVVNGEVTLRGSIPSLHQRQELVERVKRLPGVDKVDDQLKVDLK